MDDLTFLRNLAQRGRVALLASAEGDFTVAVPRPTSVLDDETRAGATFRIPLLSPEGVWSGDGRNFKPGTVTHRELPLPLLWQPMLDDGHKTAVIVGRLDSMVLTPEGWGDVRGVFDTGPWGREAQRLNDAGMLRFVSADYDDFEATVLEKHDDDDEVIKDNRIEVTKSRIMAATLVAKPAFQEATLEITTDPFVLDGEYSPEPFALAASGDPDLISQLQQRLARLELLQEDRRRAELVLLASAARGRTLSTREARHAALIASAEAARERFLLLAAGPKGKQTKQTKPKPSPVPATKSNAVPVKTKAPVPAKAKAPAAVKSKAAPVKAKAPTPTKAKAPQVKAKAPAPAQPRGTKAGNGVGKVGTDAAPGTKKRAPRAYDRWPSGAGASKGGEFAPGNTAGTTRTGKSSAPAPTAPNKPAPAKKDSGGGGGSSGNGGSSSAKPDTSSNKTAKVMAEEYLALAENQQADYLKALNDDQLKLLSQELFKKRDGSMQVAAARAAITAELAARKLSVYDFGADKTGLERPESTIASRNGADLEGLTDKDVQVLQTSGWKGDPTDSREALYPPNQPQPLQRGSLSDRAAQRLLDAGWTSQTVNGSATLNPPAPDKNGVLTPPSRHGTYDVVQSYEDGSAVYSDGYTWDPDTRTYELLKRKS